MVKKDEVTTTFDDLLEANRAERRGSGKGGNINPWDWLAYQF
jgi:hypothetical protein